MSRTPKWYVFGRGPPSQNMLFQGPLRSKDFSRKCLLKDLHTFVWFFQKIADLQARSAALGAALWARGFSQGGPRPNTYCLGGPWNDTFFPKGVHSQMHIILGVPGTKLGGPRPNTYLFEVHGWNETWGSAAKYISFCRSANMYTISPEIADLQARSRHATSL